MALPTLSRRPVLIVGLAAMISACAARVEPQPAASKASTGSADETERIASAAADEAERIASAAADEARRIASAAIDESRRIVSRHKAVFNAPPRGTPSRFSVDGPLLGNGDMGVAIGGPPEAQRFWISKNDFWRIRSVYKQGGPRVFGSLDVSAPGMKGASYLVEQDFYGAVTVSKFTREGTALTMRSLVAATENILIVELSAEGGEVEVALALTPSESKWSVSEAGRKGDISWATRTFTQGVETPTSGACAMRVLGAEGTALTVRPGSPVTIAVAMASVFDTKPPMAAVEAAVKAFDADRLAELRGSHASWWRDFWALSWVEIGDPGLEQRYYLSNYVMGSSSRLAEFPPGLFGVWVTSNTPGWAGDYHLNYNHMAPFYGLYSSNHIEQADPYHAPLVAFLERGRHYASTLLNVRGVYFPVGIGPRGMETSRMPGRGGKNYEKGGAFFQQKSNAAYGLVNVAMRWYHTYDTAYAKELYPYVIEVANFWEDYLKFEDGRYVIYNDAVHEGSGEDFNSIVSLALARNAFELALEFSEAIGLDAERREKWRHILKHLSGFATQEMEGVTVFRYTEKGTPWWKGNTLGIQHIYPAGAIGPGSDPKLLEIARNTIRVMGRWVDGNGMNSFYPAAVLVGYDPEIILEKLRAMLANKGRVNGFIEKNPHGIENCSIVPNTVNMMLCMSHGHVLRVFANWPREQDARFGNIRAWGAFLVSSELKGGKVQHVRIVSERGRECRIVNPWPGGRVAVLRGGRRAETVDGERITLKTAVGETLELRPAED